MLWEPIIKSSPMWKAIPEPAELRARELGLPIVDISALITS
jgi:hypothetical protein